MKDKLYREANKDKVKASRRRYQDTNAERLAAERRSRRAARPQHYRDINKKYTVVHRERVRQQRRRSYVSNRDDVLARNLNWRLENRRCPGRNEDGSQCESFVKIKGGLCAQHDPDKRNFTRKELRVANYLRVMLSKTWAAWNRRIRSSEMSKRAFRPDFVFKTKYGIIVLEIDEHQHKYYDATEEMERMRCIAASFVGHNVTFVRWNPDGFVSHGIRSRLPFNKKLQILTSFLEKIFETDPQDSCDIHYMFYDHDYVDDSYCFTKNM